MAKTDLAGLLPRPCHELRSPDRTATRPLCDIVTERCMHFGGHILRQLPHQLPKTAQANQTAPVQHGEGLSLMIYAPKTLHGMRPKEL